MHTLLRLDWGPRGPLNLRAKKYLCAAGTCILMELS